MSKLFIDLQNYENPRRIDTYVRYDAGYQALKAAFAVPPADVIQIVKDSGLRGRGGAGFPTGLKWSFVPKAPGEKYLITNFDEGEPGTFKDCFIAKANPHSLIEGMILGSYAIGASKSYIYIRGEFYDEIAWLETAIKEAYAAGYLGDNICGSGFTHHMDLYFGAGAYICGEETGLISSLEGKKGQPKLKPPFPAIQGYLKKPTLVNNVETLAVIPWIIRNGAAAYKAIGTEKSPGTKLFTVSGPVKKPGVYEVPLGYPLMDLINNECQGLLDGEVLKAIIPGGSSAPILTAKECENLTLDYECIQAAGSMLGSGAIIVIPERITAPDLLENLMDFYAHESCGQCTPCREGTGWLLKTSKQLQHKVAFNKTEKTNATEYKPAQFQDIQSDMMMVQKIANQMKGRTICVLSDAAADPALAIIKKFAHEFQI
jgi:NADH-quinone oxidoreductase subunit F